MNIQIEIEYACRMARGFRCACCGEWHDDVPLVFAVDEPLYVAELDPAARASLVVSAGDFRELQCDGATHYFIRGMIEIPIIGTEDIFRYGVWTSLSAQSFAAATGKRSGAGPFLGWLSNDLPGYPSTLNLKTRAHLRPGACADLELEPTDHPLAIEQREGITMDRVHQIVAINMHPPSGV